MHADSAHRQQIECPRCGYAVDTAIHAAKTRGESVVICSECGLDSNIALLESESDCPPWLIESRVGRHHVVSRFLRTLGRSLIPHRFWRTVRMEAPVSRRGLVAYLACIAVVLHFIAFAAVAPIIVAEHRSRGTSSLPDLAFAAVLPLCPALGSDIMVSAAQGNPERSVDAGTIVRFASAALRITVERERLTILKHVPQSPDARGPFADPIPATNANAAIVRINHWLHRTHLGMLAALAVASLAAMATGLLVLLPISLRRVKVRKAHLVRAGVYATALLPIVCALYAAGWFLISAGVPLAQLPARIARSTGKGILGAALGVSLIFALLWLHAVCSRYLRLPHAWLIALLLTIVAALLEVGALAIVNGGSL
jgi:hypothetical protein